MTWSSFLNRKRKGMGGGGCILSYAINTTNIMKNNIRTANILIISHRFDVTDWKYFRISLCAASTFRTASSVFESILKNHKKKKNVISLGMGCQRIFLAKEQPWPMQIQYFIKKTKPYANILQAKKHFGGIFSNCTNYS